jgi:hypothetical protein
MAFGLVVWALALGVLAPSPSPAALRAAMGGVEAGPAGARAAAPTACERLAPSPSAAASVEPGDDAAALACGVAVAGGRFALLSAGARPARVVDRAPARAHVPRGPPARAC